MRASRTDDFKGLLFALSDDGQIGPNDAPALRALARSAGSPRLERLVDLLETPYVPPKRDVRLPGSGFAQEVVSFKPGRGGGFNANQLSLVLGRPEGRGAASGSLHVVSLGQGGQITLELGRAVTQGLKVFENGFGNQGGRAINPELARVEVSADGATWFTLNGEAGKAPVYANSQNKIRPRSRAAGGDTFSFAQNGIPAGTAIRYVRITDLGQSSGPSVPSSGTDGFDLDAVYGFNS